MERVLTASDDRSDRQVATASYDRPIGECAVGDQDSDSTSKRIGG